MGLTLKPLSLRDANAYISEVHRHHGPTQGYKFAIGAIDEDSQALVGVVTVGRPVNRSLDDGLTAEVTRLATNGTHNACSFLYGAAWRTAKAMGYTRIVTYILESEPGTSLAAVGWIRAKEVKGVPWDHPSRPRIDKHPLVDKVRWEVSIRKVS